ncbi:hypothetical protein [Endozoicomonas atrinae]|uniref:hypothetical protein n=1 Tax=Endozoicomonas atrinae TaxID=1333660 RepID=UPI003AFFE465
MNPPIAIANSTPFSHTLPPENVYHNDDISEDCWSTTTETCSKDNEPSERSDTLSVRKCEVIPEPETFMSKIKRYGKRLLSQVPKALCIPLRTCTTLLNVGIFAGYYVTVMTITGIGAIAGAMRGIASNIKARATSTPAEKSIKEYTVSYTQKVFKWLTLPYEKLPDKFKGSVFPAIAGAALFVFETVAIPGKRISQDRYEQVCTATYKATKPYKLVTDMTVNVFNTTKRWIQT